MSTSQIAAIGQSVPASPAPVAAGKTDTARAMAKPAVAEAAQTPRKDVDRAELEQAVATLNKFIEPTAQEVNFSIDKETDKLVVKVMDTASNTVLHQFPSEEALAMTRALDKLSKLRGMLLGKVQA
jgi:flagellar protein FlaG